MVLKIQVETLCGHCDHSEVCKYRMDYEDVLHSLKKGVPTSQVFSREVMKHFTVKLECKFYQ